MQQNRFGAVGRTGQLLILLCCLWLPLAAAETADDGLDQGLSVSLGYVSTSGNADTTTGNMKALYTLSWDRLTLSLDGSFLYTDVTDETTGETNRKKERYAAALKGDYHLWDKGSVFTNIRWLKDEPSGISSSVSLSSGFGRTFRDRNGVKLTGGLGLEGFRETRLEEDGTLTRSAMAAYMQWNLAWRFNDHNQLKLANDSRMNLSDSEDYRTTSNLTFHSAINAKLAVEIAYEHQYRNQPVDGRERTDTTTTVNLVFKF